MPHRNASSFLATVLPFVPAVAGLWAAAVRFRAHDDVGGLAFGLSGMLLLLVLAIALGRRAAA